MDETCQETGGKQELAYLCKLMLVTVDIHHDKFYGVFVSATSAIERGRDRQTNRQTEERVRVCGGEGVIDSLHVKPENKCDFNSVKINS